MNFLKVVDHSVRHKFLTPDYSGLSFLGSSLAQRLEKEWYANTYIQNANAYLLDQCPVESTNVKLFQHFLNAKLFSGCGEKSISLVSRLSAPSSSSPREVDNVPSLLKCLPSTTLTLYTLIPPLQKMDEFSRLQRKRRLWWKSLLYRPEHLQLTNLPSPETIGPFLEQRIEYRSKTVEPEPLEVMSLYTPQVFESCEANDDLKRGLMVKYQRKNVYPWLVVTQMRLELAVWYLLSDGFDIRNKNYVLYLHNDVAPYQVGVLNDSGPGDQHLELEDLRRLISLKLSQSRVPVLPMSNPWSVSQCDARGVPYLIVLANETLNNGVCHIRSRNTSLKEEVHITDVVPRLKKVLIK